MKLDAVSQNIIDAIDAHADRLKEISLSVYENPELGNREFKAAGIAAEELENHGFVLERGLRGIKPDSEDAVFLETAFKATYRGKESGSTIALLLEYDALPQFGHGCGHNLILGAGLGAAIGLSKTMADLPGTLIVYGTPAEEGRPPVGNKTEMVPAGHFDDVDVVLASHPGDRWDTGAHWLALKAVNIDFHGVASHAASAPEEGINALATAYLFFNGVDALRQHVRSGTRMSGTITKGGTTANIVPDFAQVVMLVRAFDKPTVESVAKRVENIIEGACLMTGARAEYQWNRGAEAPINVPILDELVMNNVILLGADRERIKEWTAYASSDLGDVGVVVPTMNLFFPAGPEGTPLHSEAMVKAAGSSEGLEAMITASKIMAVSASDLFKDSELVNQIREEFFQLRRASHGF
jgi:amidohydrolase